MSKHEQVKPHKSHEHHEKPPTIAPADEVEAIIAEVEAAESPAGTTNHKYRRDDKRGGFTCAHCKKNITDPSEIGAKTCPAP